MKKVFQVGLILLVLFFGFQQYFLLNNAFDKGLLFQNHDWKEHAKMIKGNFADNYPHFVYLFYPTLKFVFFHVFIIIPLLLFLLSRKVGVNPWGVLLLYTFFSLPLEFIDHGYLKQILFTEFSLLFLWLSLELNEELLLPFSLLIGGLVNGVQRSLTYFNLLFVNRFNDFGYYLKAGQLMGFWSVLLLPFVLIIGLREKWLSPILFWFGVITLFLGLFETRILLTLLVLYLPYVSKLTEKISVKFIKEFGVVIN